MNHPNTIALLNKEIDNLNEFVINCQEIMMHPELNMDLEVAQRDMSETEKKIDEYNSVIERLEGNRDFKVVYHKKGGVHESLFLKREYEKGWRLAAVSVYRDDVSYYFHR